MTITRRIPGLWAILVLAGTTTTSPIQFEADLLSLRTLIVNSTRDAVDAKPGDGGCNTSRIVWERRPTCTLRAAVMEANAYPGPDTIIFDVDGTFTLTLPGAGEDGAASGDLDITESVTIRGNGVQQTIIDGDDATVNDRVFHIDPAGRGPTVSISFLTIQNGNAEPAAEGGGVLNGVCRATGVPACDRAARESSLTMDHVVIRSNAVSGLPYAFGGGIANNGFLHLTQSTIDGNNATAAGGLGNGLLARAELDHVLISNNTASLDTRPTPNGAGGGIFNSDTAVMKITDSQVFDNKAPLGSGAGISNAGDLTIEKMEITSNESGFWGGGVLNGGLIHAFLVTIADNIARGGGGVYNAVGGRLLLQSATISNNSADSLTSGGGGIRNAGTMELTNVTLSENRADPGSGGAIYNGNQSTSGLTAALANVTVNGNQSSRGAGIYNPGSAAAIVLTNTILAGSQMGSNCAGQITSNGHNLDTDNTCGFAGAGDIVVRDPHLAPLEDNGGYSRTHRLGAGREVFFDPSGPPRPPIFFYDVVSAAVDAGDSVSCPRTDQRGVIRPVGKGCDIGAYEFP